MKRLLALLALPFLAAATISVPCTMSGGVLTCPIPTTSATIAPQAPGPSATLYATPFYTATSNRYVSTTGNDSYDGTSATHTTGTVGPWLTIQHADASAVAGEVVNVTPGTYSGAILLTHGGNAPTATGYVAYRCQTLDGCHVLATAGGHLWGIKQPANFIVIDGFEIDGNNAAQANGIADACVGSDGDTYGTANSSHHLWVLNNVIHHCNLAGVDFNNSEWHYIIHNTVYHNSWTSGYQGSGIGLVVEQCIEAGNANCYAPGSGSYAGGTGTYTPSGMDLSSYPASTGTFHIVAAYNDVHNNEIASPANGGTVACDGSHTDGNGIIWDTWLDETNHALIYPYQSTIDHNLSYANGGRGVHVFNASNATISNNTAYGNGTDNCISAYTVADLSQAGGQNNLWLNNIAYTLQTANVPANCSYCGGQNVPLSAGNASYASENDLNNTYSGNILYGTGGGTVQGGFAQGQAATFNNDVSYWNCTANKCATNPLLVSPPSNFALATGSPAIGYGGAVPGSSNYSDSGAFNHTITQGGP